MMTRGRHLTPPKSVVRVSQAVADACQRDIQADVLTLGAGSEKLLVFRTAPTETG